MADIIQIHRIANAVSVDNPITKDGELTYNEVNGDLRIGDGTTAYNSQPRIDMAGAVLPYKASWPFDTNDVCLYGGSLYKSLQDSNSGNQPDISPLYWEAVGSGSGMSVALNWEYDNTTTAADPGAGKFRLNNATIASATTLYINESDADGIDTGSLLAELTANDFFYLENPNDVTEALLAKVATVTDNTGWFTITYTVEDTGSASTWTDADEFGALLWFRGGSGGGHVIQDDGSAMTQRTNLNFKGNGFDVTDDSTNDATVIEIAEASSPLVVDNDGFTEILTDRDLEESTGSWRPIYRKTLSIGALPNNQANVEYAHGISNYSRIWISGESRGVWIADPSAESLPLPYAHPTDIQNIGLYVRGANVRVTTTKNWSGYGGYVVLEYTKTTDTATTEPRKTQAGGLGGDATNVLYDSGVLTAATTSIAIPDLVTSGKTYLRLVVTNINTAGTNNGIALYVNNDTNNANYRFTQFGSSGSTPWGTNSGAGNQVNHTRATGNESVCTIDAFVIGGKMIWMADTTNTGNNDGTMEKEQVGGKKHTGTVTDLSGMSVVASVANSFGIGSRVMVIDPHIASGGSTASSSAPASASASGVAGTLAYDSSYLYVCTATDTWKRTALSTWS